MRDESKVKGSFCATSFHGEQALRTFLDKNDNENSYWCYNLFERFFCCFSQEPQIANVPHCKHRTEPRLKFSYIIELAKYIGFDIPNEFVVGFGLDYAEKYRNLREVGVLAPHVYGG